MANVQEELELITPDVPASLISKTIALLALKEFAAPGLGSVRVASLEAAFLIVPELSTSELVAT